MDFMLASKGEETGNQKPHEIRGSQRLRFAAYLQNAAEDESSQIIATSHDLTPKR